MNDLKSPPVTAHAKAARRESLTGVQTSGSNRSRRSSLGGKPIELSKYKCWHHSGLFLCSQHIFHVMMMEICFGIFLCRYSYEQ